ncbi:MAG: flagellar biosynthesis regulator FlaF [Cypionkella sp.]|nr:flagellar biosynthesis regulator FlaF [Cypionkella sp.]
MIAARSLYVQSEAPPQMPRRAEYDLLARCTQRLKAAASTRRQNYAGLVTALEENQRLWSTLAADVADEGNTLPAKLRAQLFYLYEFTAHHSRTVRDDNGSVEVLIDINTAVMRGLRGEGGGV